MWQEGRALPERRLARSPVAARPAAGRSLQLPPHCPLSARRLGGRCAPAQRTIAPPPTVRRPGSRIGRLAVLLLSRLRPAAVRAAAPETRARRTDAAGPGSWPALSAADRQPATRRSVRQPRGPAHSCPTRAVRLADAEPWISALVTAVRPLPVPQLPEQWPAPRDLDQSVARKGQTRPGRHRPRPIG